MMEELGSSETMVLTRATRRNIAEDDILHSHRHENLKFYILHISSGVWRLFFHLRYIYIPSALQLTTFLLISGGDKSSWQIHSGLCTSTFRLLPKPTKTYQTVRHNRRYTRYTTICLLVIPPMRNIRFAPTRPEILHTCNATSIGLPPARPPNRLGYFSVYTPTQQVQEGPAAVSTNNKHVYIHIHKYICKSPNSARHRTFG
jgi:hypothetical protein